MRTSLLTLSCVLGAACGPRTPQIGAMAQPIEEAPAWQTETGRREVWRKMATWYIDTGLADLAMEMVERLHDAGEYTPELDVIQARAQTAQGIPLEAVRLLETVVRKHPTMIPAWRALGVALVDVQDYDRAIDAFRKASKLDPHDASVRNNLGFVLLSKHRCAEAIPEFEAAVSENGTEARYRNNLAFAAVCVGDHERALSLFRTTMEEGDARYNLGIAYERLDASPSAILQYRAALQANPEHTAAREALERLEPSSQTATAPTTSADSAPRRP